MAGRPCSRKNWATTSSRVSASKSAPTRLVQPDGGASIHKVGDLHHMLALAVWISGNTTGIFEIELDFLPWVPQFQRLGLAATVLGHTASFSQDLPDRCLRTRQAHTGLCECWITMQ